MGPDSKHLTHCDQPKHWLILPDPTAIGIRLRYASRTPVTTFRSGEPLSNTLTTYPQDGDNYGKICVFDIDPETVTNPR